MIFAGFPALLRRIDAAAGIDEGRAINDCPAKLIWSHS
jgi:hypothetical protein